MNKVRFLLTCIMIATLVGIVKAQESGKKGPEIEFEKTIHDYGEVPYNGDGYCEFRFTNTGDEPLVLQKPKSSCGCFFVIYWPQISISPGNSDVIKARYSTTCVGIINEKLTVQSNTTQNSIVELNVKGQILENNDNQPISSSASKINGMVTDKSNKIGIANAVVSATNKSSGEQYSRNTDTDGFYRLLNCSEGTYEITVTHNDYKQKTKEIMLKPNNTRTVDFALESLTAQTIAQKHGETDLTPTQNNTMSTNGIKDDFDDNNIDRSLWTSVGPLVVEKNGIVEFGKKREILPIDIDNVTNLNLTLDKDFMIKSKLMTINKNNTIVILRRINPHPKWTSALLNNYQGYTIRLNGRDDMTISVNYVVQRLQRQDGPDRPDRKHGVFITSNINGVKDVKKVAYDPHVRDNKWVTEMVSIDLTNGTVAYFCDNLQRFPTMEFTDLKTQTINSYDICFYGQEFDMDYVHVGVENNLFAARDYFYYYESQNESLQKAIENYNKLAYTHYSADFQDKIISKINSISDAIYCRDNFKESNNQSVPRMAPKIEKKMFDLIKSIADCKTFFNYYSTTGQYGALMDSKLYDYVSTSNRVEDCDTYLSYYPQGQYKSMVESQKTEILCYQTAKRGGKAECTTYLTKYPNGRFTSEIQSKKDGIVKEEKRQAQIKVNSNKGIWKLGNKLCNCTNSGIIMVTLDQWNEDKSMFKGIVSASPGGLFKGDLLQKGNSLWFETKDWHICLDDEVEFALNHDKSLEAEQLMKAKKMKFAKGTVVAHTYYSRGWLFSSSYRVTAKVDDWNDDYTRMKIQIVKTDGLDYIDGESIYEGKYIWVSPIGWE